MKDEKDGLERQDDSDITIYDETAGALSKQKSKKFLAVYIIGLFSVALVLILLSYLTQVRANQQVDALGHQLTQQANVAEGAKANAEKLQKRVTEQEQELAALRGQLEEANAQLESVKQGQASAQEQITKKDTRIAALDDFWKLERAYRQKKYTSAQEMIDAMEEKYGAEALADSENGPLAGSACEEFQAIKKRIDD